MGTNTSDDRDREADDEDRSQVGAQGITFGVPEEEREGSVPASILEALRAAEAEREQQGGVETAAAGSGTSASASRYRSYMRW